MLTIIAIVIMSLALILRAKCKLILAELSCGQKNDYENDEDFEEEEKGLNVIIEYQPPKYTKNPANFGCCRSNKQESLFPCGRFGISIMVVGIQTIFSVCLLGTIGLVWYEILDIHKNSRWGFYILLCITLILYLGTLLFIIPKCVNCYMMVTNVKFYLS